MADTISTLAQKLRPHWLRDVANVTATASGGAVGVTDHGALTGLFDDDHTQYLTPVRGDARYIPSTRTLTAGAGLTGGGDLSADRTFTVGAGLGITVNADDVALTTPGTLTVSSTNSASGSHTHAITSSSNPGAAARILATDSGGALTLVDLTVSSDLFMTGTLDFGTNTMYEDASYLQVAGSKAVRFGQNIGNANWTVYNTGGASFSGNVDIISGGDLTVAGSGSYAGSNVLFADSSGGNVGIMMAPDPQFALDINGPARATYWIGPHAIQLKNVLLLAHYDGRAPYETNYTGEPNGHMGQVGAVSGGLIFRPGKFYKAAQIAPYTVNLVTNPSFEVDTSGWSAYNSATISRSSTQSLYGSYSLACITGASGRGAQITVTGLTASTAHTVSVWAYCDNATTVSIAVTDNIDLDSGTTSLAIPAATWTRVVKTFNTDTHTSVIVRITATNTTAFYIDAVQLEAKAYTTAYADGTLGGYDANGVWYASGTGHSWTGTAHASTTVRSEGRLSYAASGNFQTLTGTLICWVKFDAAGISRTIATGATNGSIAIAVTSTAIEVSRRNVGTVLTGAQTWTANTWYHLAVTWEGRAVTAYVNGVSVGTATAGGDFATPTTLYVGRAADDTSTLNGSIDDFCILDRVLPASEIRSVYESNAPVFAETSTFSFRPTPKGLIWADDEGLWMRDSAGSPVLGAYGGEAATKSWAGFTMAAGDIVFGRNAVGSSAIWWDQSAGTFGFYGGGGTVQVLINTDGTLYSGTSGAQRVQLSSAELAGYNSSNQKQWYGSTTDGKLYAGGGNVALDANGLTLDIGDYQLDKLFPYVDIAWKAGSAESGRIGSGELNNVDEYGMRFWAGGAGGTQSGNGRFEFISRNGSGTQTGLAVIVDGAFSGEGQVSGASLAAVSGGVFAGGEETGLAGYTQLTNTVNTSLSSGTGTVKMAGATSRNNVGWLKLYSGTTAIYVPYWTTITG